jgi:hypothetical protein
VDGVAVMQKAQNTALRQWLAGLMQKGVSQRELARRLNVSASKLNRFVCGVQDKFYVGAHDLETAAVMFSSPLPPAVAVYVSLMLSAEKGITSHTAGADAARVVPLYPMSPASGAGMYIRGPEPIDHVAPAPGAPVAGQYAVQMPDNRLAPAFRAGHVLYVSSQRPPMPGDDVLIAAGMGCEIRYVGADADVPSGAHWIFASSRRRG